MLPRDPPPPDIATIMKKGSTMALCGSEDRSWALLCSRMGDGLALCSLGLSSVSYHEGVTYE